MIAVLLPQLLLPVSLHVWVGLCSALSPVSSERLVCNGAGWKWAAEAREPACKSSTHTIKQSSPKCSDPKYNLFIHFRDASPTR